MISQGENSGDDVLGGLWDTMEERTKNILELRLLNFTLADIGHDLDLTRERIRQLESQGKGAWGTLVSAVNPSLGRWLKDALATDGVVSLASLKEEACTEKTVGMEVFLQAMGFQKYRAWGEELKGWWVKDPSLIDTGLQLLADNAPFMGAELEERSIEAGIPTKFPIAKALASSRSGLVQDSRGHWVRRRNKGADSAYMYLSEHVRPASLSEIATGTGHSSTRVLANALYRDTNRFTMIRPEGLWALKDWRNVEGTAYTDASEALIAVLRDMGPLSYQQLSLETQRRYPVTQWRINQCLYHVAVGQTADGRYELVEHGGQPIDHPEPAQPKSMAVSGGKLAMKLRVTSEVLRGSGIAVNGWLAWKLGLYYYPSELEFTNVENVNPQSVIVRRNGSGASVSSLRAFAVAGGLVAGCLIAVIFDQSTTTVRLRHACGSACPMH